MSIQPETLTKLYLEVFMNIRHFEFIEDPVLKPKALATLTTCLKQWLALMKKSSDQELEAFSDNNVDHLVFIKESLLKIDSVGFRSLHDQIFKNILKINKKPPTLTTKLFGEFIPGITYFKIQEPFIKYPIYHRLLSCGPGTPEFRNNFNKCTETMTRTNRDDVKKRIETCYIERLMYNDIYRKTELFIPGEERSQNPGHINWLDLETKGDFATCFPNVNLEVNVDLKRFLTVSKPVSVKIVRSINGSHKSTLVFKRRVNIDTHGTITYDPFVDCIKTIESKNGKVTKWYKIQEFDMEVDKWKRIA
jgi:hypothetical protein